MNTNHITLLLISGLLMSCGGEATEESAEVMVEETVIEASAPACTYTLDNAAASVYWTAYKHTDKIAVNGRMDSVIVEGAVEGSAPLEVVQALQIKIWSNSVNSKDPVRDKKLKEIYFGGMANTAFIQGSVKSFQGSETYGTCTFSLVMNDMEREVSGKYTTDETKVQLRFTIVPEEWNAKEAVAALGEACSEKHTGKDGKTIFWPNVDVLVELALNKDCPDPI